MNCASCGVVVTAPPCPRSGRVATGIDRLHRVSSAIKRHRIAEHSWRLPGCGHRGSLHFVTVLPSARGASDPSLPWRASVSHGGQGSSVQGSVSRGGRASPVAGETLLRQRERLPWRARRSSVEGVSRGGRASPVAGETLLRPRELHFPWRANVSRSGRDAPPSKGASPVAGRASPGGETLLRPRERLPAAGRPVAARRPSWRASCSSVERSAFPWRASVSRGGQASLRQAAVSAFSPDRRFRLRHRRRARSGSTMPGPRRSPAPACSRSAGIELHPGDVGVAGAAVVDLPGRLRGHPVEQVGPPEERLDTRPTSHSCG